MTKLKICGLRTRQDIEMVNKAMPDYIGFVFAESRRRVDLRQAYEMKESLDEGIAAIGVFVNSSLDEIIQLCKRGIIDGIQLHGDEDEAYIQELKSVVSNPVIKAVRVKSTEQILAAQILPCDYLLLDAFDGRQYGGSGKSFDWTVIPRLQKQFFLAGGLNAVNIRTAIEEYRPYCVDVSSGVETGGMKDEVKINELVQIIRSVE